MLLRGSFSKRSTARRVNESTGQMGQRITFTFTFTILYMIADYARLTPLRCKKHTGSTGQWVHGSTGQMGRRVTFTFTILYMMADDARLMPPRCKKHTAYDDTRLTPHFCKKHTASFARSTGKFPSTCKFRPSSLDTCNQDNYSTVGGYVDVGLAGYEPALFSPCPTVRGLSYSNCQRSADCISE